MKIRLLTVFLFLLSVGNASAFEVYNHFLYERIAYPGQTFGFGPRMQQEVFDWNDATLVSHAQDFPELALKTYVSAGFRLDSSPSNWSVNIPANKLEFSSKVLTLGVSWEALPAFFVELGKKKIKTGNGYFRSPTDFLGFNPSAAAGSSAAAEEKFAEGLVGIDLEYMAEWADLHEFFSPWIDWDHTNNVDLKYLQTPQKNWQNLFTAGFRVLDSDFMALTHTAWDTNGVPLTRFGLSGTMSVGENWVFHAAAAVAQRASNSYVTNTTNFTLADRELSWVPSAIAGFTYSFTPDDALTVEYSFDGRGLAGQEYLDALGYMSNRAAAFPPSFSRDLFSECGLFHAGQHYLFERYSKNFRDQKASFEALNINNLQDGSGMAGLALTFSPDVCNLTARLQAFYGKPESETGLANVLWQMTAEAEIFVF